MKIALACFSFKVLGGRERDCLEIARGLAHLGHQVVVLTTAPPPGSAPGIADGLVDVATVPRRGWSNHGRVAHFAHAARLLRREVSADALIGFDKMPGLDYYYAAAQPLPTRSSWQALLPRYRVLAKHERAVFAPGARPFIFFLAQLQADAYGALYGLERDRWTVLPPTLHPDRVAPSRFYEAREAVRAQLDVPQNHRLVISVAAYGRQKGLDRTIEALAAVPDTTLVSVGLKQAEAFRTIAARAGTAERVRFLPYTDRIDHLIGAADLMVHPARVEATGTVIVESLLFGVPVLTSDVCGYAVHVQEAGAGRVVPEPIAPADLARHMRQLLAPDHLAQIRQKARDCSAGLAATPGMSGIAARMSEIIQLRQSERPAGKNGVA